MPGDEVHEEPGGGAAAAPDAGGRRAGARHAAPRKALLNRLHMPAGKAIALAAMPSAVLLGMGITPQLASAKSIPKNPFKGDTCVSEQDQAQEDDDATGAAGDAADKAGKAAEDAGDAVGAEADKASSAAEDAATAAKVRATKAVKDAEKAAKKYQTAKKKSEDDSADSGGLLGGGSEGSDSSDDEAADEEEPENPLDPLGLGDKLKDLFTPDDSDDATAEGSEDAEDSESAEEEKAPAETDPTLRKLQKAAEEAKEKAEASLADAKAKLAKAKKQAAKESEKSGSSQESEKGSTGKETDSSQKTSGKQGSDSDSADSEDSGKASEKADGSGEIPDLGDLKKDENGQASYPCVEEKKDDGENESTPAAIPDDPWQLQASSLTLHSLDYKGVVNLTTASGKKKQALKFTASGLEIGDLHQTVEGPGGKTYHVRAAEGSTSTVDDGQVTMYTEELKGKLFGLIPITFSPDTPPPLNVPEAYFTDVTVQQAAQFGGTLTVPGLQMDITD